MSHFLLMSIYAAMVAIFFSALWRRRPLEQLKLFAQVFLAMVVGGLLLAYLMMALPSGPPAAP